MNLLMLSKAYMKVGRYNKAVQCLKKLKEYSEQTPEDKKARVVFVRPCKAENKLLILLISG